MGEGASLGNAVAATRRGAPGSSGV